MVKQHKPTDDLLVADFLSAHQTQYTWMYEFWHRYENGVWKEDEVNPVIDMLSLLVDKKAVGIKPTIEKANSLLKYAGLYMRPGEEQDDVRPYINLRNGLYNLNTGKLEAHRRELYLRSQLNLEYDPKARCPAWEAFLDSVLVDDDGKPDISLQIVLQQAFGYSLTASTHHRVSFWLVGASGTGKSTLLNMLIELAGDAHVAIDLEFLTKNEYQFAALPGSRVVTFTEPSAGVKLEDGAYKRLVSQDTLTGRNPHGRHFQFVGEFKVWGAMNELPRVIDRSDAVYNRVLVFPMNRVVPPEQRDPHLIDKLRAEKSGIFNWALEGLEYLNLKGHFDRSATIEAARNEWRIENDTEAAFVEDECETGEGFEVAARELYSRYREWCRDNGYYSKSERSVGRDWVRLGAVKKRRSTGVVYVGLKLKSREVVLP